MKNSILKIYLIALTLPILTGCLTTRTATYPDDDYDTVFKRTVKNLCSDPDLLVYEADKSNGVIKVQGRQALFVNPPVGTQLNIKGAKGETPVTADITMPGMSNIWADRLISATAGPVTKPKKEPVKSELIDSVYLKNGTVVKGKITEDTNEYVIVEHDNKWEKINRADIEKIIRN
ncbi:MAG: hypothetical protein ACP5SD_01645 [Elusimicrobiales bacterium]